MIVSTLNKRGFAWPRLAQITLKRSLRKKQQEAESPSLNVFQAWERVLAHQADLMIGTYTD
jgi:hypothetical protein